MSEKETKGAGAFDIIIETPRGCRNKYAYDKVAKAFKLTKIMPVGMVFPFDFGFIPNTKGDDGDPLDVLIIMDEAAYPGCVVECRIVGVLKAMQTEDEKTTVENDRLIAVSVLSHTYNDVKDLKDVNKNVLRDIEHFFVSYNAMAGKKFQPQGWGDAREAMQLIEKSKK